MRGWGRRLHNISSGSRSGPLTEKDEVGSSRKVYPRRGPLGCDLNDMSQLCKNVRGDRPREWEQARQVRRSRSKAPGLGVWSGQEPQRAGQGGVWSCAGTEAAVQVPSGVIIRGGVLRPGVGGLAWVLGCATPSPFPLFIISLGGSGGSSWGSLSPLAP